MNTSLISNPKLTNEVGINPIALNFKLGFYKKLIQIGRDTFLKSYYQFFLKEIIYFLYQEVFQRAIFDTLSKNFPDWKNRQFKTFQQIFLSINYDSHLMPQSYLTLSLLVQNEEISLKTTRPTCWKIFSNTFRNHIIRNNNVSIRFIFLTLHDFKFLYPEHFIEENIDFFFLRVNSTNKNQKLNLIIFKFFFSINLFYTAKKNSFNLKSYLLDILIINIINGKIGGRDNLYLKPIQTSPIILFDLDNYYQILKPLYFLGEVENFPGKEAENLKNNYNFKFWKTTDFNTLPQKTIVCLKKKNLFHPLINLNGIDFLKLSAFKF